MSLTIKTSNTNEICSFPTTKSVANLGRAETGSLRNYESPEQLCIMEPKNTRLKEEQRNKSLKTKVVDLQDIEEQWSLVSKKICL